MNWQGHRGGKKSIGAKNCYNLIINCYNAFRLTDFPLQTQGARLRILGICSVVPFHTIYMAVSSPVHSASISFHRLFRVAIS